MTEGVEHRAFEPQAGAGGGIATAHTEVPVIEFYESENENEPRRVRVLDVAIEVLPLPEDTAAQRFIPNWKSMESSVCWDGPTVRLIRDLGLRLNGGIPSRSEGPTGVSKSFAVEVLAALTQRSYLRHNYSRDSDPGDTIGRFVPSDQKIAIRFKELLADKDLPETAREIVEKAESENRPLSVFESRKVAAAIGISGLEDGSDWRWQNGTLVGSMSWGSVYGADEVNLAPGNVVERENSALEKRPKMRIVEHEGEVVRELTQVEQDIIDAGGVIPGVIGLNNQFWYAAAQNPWGIGGGRVEESEARRNRLQDRIVEALTKTEYEEYLRFLIKGEQPNIEWNGHTYIGGKDMPTDYRDLEAIPNVDVLIGWLAGFQSDLQKLVVAGQIGTEKDIKGGSYVFTRRNIERFLDTIKGAQTALLDPQKLFDEGKIEYSSNWRDIVSEAIYQEYLIGMYQDDQEVVQPLIAASGIEDQLGASANDSKLPAWAKKAEKSGVKVESRPGQWAFNRTSLTGESVVDIDAIIAAAIEEGYQEEIDTSVEPPESIMRKPLRGILDLFDEREKAVEPAYTISHITEEPTDER